MSSKLKIYLAGPEVFKEDAIEVGKSMKKYCKKKGFKGLFPLDKQIIAPTKKEASMAIFEANRAMIEKADIVVANLNDFRGSEPDSGTVCEIGYDLGKITVGYLALYKKYFNGKDFK